MGRLDVVTTLLECLDRIETVREIDGGSLDETTEICLYGAEINLQAAVEILYDQEMGDLSGYGE